MPEERYNPNPFTSETTEGFNEAELLAMNADFREKMDMMLDGWREPHPPSLETLVHAMHLLVIKAHGGA